MSKRECRKCGSIIPSTIKVDGKTKRLDNRKFCLICSPYGKHNTSPIDPVERVHPHDKPYSEYTEKQKDAIKTSLYRRGLERKSKLIEMSGGKCINCGYNKCSRVLSFHHRDPESKLYCLTLNHLWSKPWENILEEWKKCDLLCANCHGEVEDNIARKTSIIEKINKIYGTNY